MGEVRNAYKILVGKPERKRQLGRPWRRWEDNLRTIIRKIVWKMCTGWIWLGIGTSGGLL
jgi:hypothetical protein